MRGYILSALTGLALIMVFGPTARAQGLPYGSYQQTCRDMRMDGDMLYARCQRVDGGWNNTQINYRSCSGQIINNDGNLQCPQGDGYRRDDHDRDRDHDRGYDRDDGLPRGDYKLTCRNMSVSGTRLYA